MKETDKIDMLKLDIEDLKEKVLDKVISKPVKKEGVSSQVLKDKHRKEIRDLKSTLKEKIEIIELINKANFINK